MESKARENQRTAREIEDASERATRNVLVETGMAVHQKNCARERKTRGKAGANGRIC
jgi:hypothetical protein